MKPRSNPTTMRALAHMLRLQDGLQQVNVNELIQQLVDAASDVEIMAEDLALEHEVMREMASDLALANPPKIFRDK